MLNRTEVQQALEAGGGLLRLDPSWVPRSFMIPGRRLKLHPDDLYACGASRGGINERWFSSTTNADNGPGTPADEGLSYVRLRDGKRFLLKDAVEQARRPPARLRRDAAGERLEPALQVLRQLGSHSPSHAPERRAGQTGRPPRQARGLLLSTAIQRDFQRVPVHVHGPRAGDDEGGRSAVPGELEPWGQRDPLPVARVQAGSRNRVADRPVHPARSRIARHLRATSEQRRLRDVPVRSRRAHRPVGADDEGRAVRPAQGSRLPRRAAGLGRQRQPHVSRPTIACSRSR